MGSGFPSVIDEDRLKDLLSPFSFISGPLRGERGDSSGVRAATVLFFLRERRIGEMGGRLGSGAMGEWLADMRVKKRGAERKDKEREGTRSRRVF